VIPPAFRRVLGARGAPRLVTASVVGRLPITFTSLATVLLVREHTGSFASAGLVAAAEAVGAATVAPIQGRLMDRFGQARILVPAAAGNAAGILALAGAAVADAPVPVLVAFGVVAGGCLPPLGASMRAMWTALLEERGAIDTAYALEAVVVEVMFIAGPVLAAGVIALASPAAALVLAAALTVAGTVAFATAGATRSWRGRPPGHDHAPGWAIAAPGMQTLVAIDFCIGTAFGSVEVAVAAFARAEGSAASAGVLLAAMAAGSMAGGLWYGTREWRGPVGTRLVAFVALFAGGLAPLLLAGSIPVMTVLLVLGGIAIAPSTACVYRLVDEVAPAGMLAEAFTWVSTATVAGIAVGAGLAGPVVNEAGTEAGLAVPCTAAVVGTLIALARRSTLAGAMVR
jgi:MFS family permease